MPPSGSYVSYRYTAAPQSQAYPSLAYLANQGQTQRTDLARSRDTAYGNAVQQAISGGMASPYMLAGIRSMGERQYQYGLTALNESLARQRLAAMQQDRQFQLSQQQLQFAQQQQGQKYGLALQGLNMQRNQLYRANQAQRYQPHPVSFMQQPQQSFAPLPGSYQSLLSNRAYQRANRLFG